MEVLKIEEFAQRMKVSRTTVFQWIHDGTLEQGRHFVKIGRVIRFQWPDVLEILAHDSLEFSEKNASQRNRKKPQGPTINLEYS